MKKTEPEMLHAETWIPLTEWQTIYQNIKRMADFLCSMFSAMVLLPAFFLIAAAIKLECPSEPVIFRQHRVGRNEVLFTMYKFRTMRSDAPSEMATSDFDESGNYITRVGKFLRRTSMDELPQLFNVIRGDMSLIGPRPLIQAEQTAHRLRSRYGVYQIRPGISGLAQVNGRDELDDVQKVFWDQTYLRGMGICMDLRVFLSSIKVIVCQSGVLEGPRKSLPLRHGMVYDQTQSPVRNQDGE